MSKRVSPQEARDLMEKDGYVYVDVRSDPGVRRRPSRPAPTTCR